MRVTLLKDAPNGRTPLAHSSKAVGEPPFFLGAAVFFALKVRAAANHCPSCALPVSCVYLRPTSCWLCAATLVIR